MMVYVLDSSALLRFVDDEGGADRVEQILSACAGRHAELRISAVQWGEVAGWVRKRLGDAGQLRVLSGILPSEANIVAASADRAVRAANLKVDRSMGYADAFALELAMDSPGCILVTADYGFKSVADLAQIEFLPLK